MKIENISGSKIIGIGDITVLPGEVKEIPTAYETSPILEVYKKCKLANITGEASALGKKTIEKKLAEEAETLRQVRLASLEGIKEEELAKLANELGIHPAECKDQTDVLKKVKAALKK